MYYIMYLLLPAIVISALNILIFVIPVETGERLGLCVTVLLTMSVFLLLVQENLPDSSEKVPLVGIFCIVAMLINAVILVCAVVVMNCYHSTKEPWKILRFLFVRKPKVQPINVAEAAKRSFRVAKMMKFEKEFDFEEGERVHKMSNLKQTTNFTKNKRKVPQLGKFHSDDELREKWKNEWAKIGAGLDRVFFWFFLFAVIGASFAVYMNAPIVTMSDNIA